MATTVGDPVFVNTNVLVYSTRPLSAHHAAAARALARIGAGGATLWISPQILREYLAVVTRPQAPLLDCRCQPRSTMFTGFGRCSA